MSSCLQVYQAFRLTVSSQCRVSKGEFFSRCQVSSWFWDVTRTHVCVDRLQSVYRMKVPWFREDYFTWVRWVSVVPLTRLVLVSALTRCRLSASVPSSAEISGMLHTSRPDNASSVLLQLHTAPNCQYKVLPLKCSLWVYGAPFATKILLVEGVRVGHMSVNNSIYTLSCFWLCISSTVLYKLCKS